MKKITIAGVPEHFNAPWHYAILNHLFDKLNLVIKFIEYPQGTGAMCADLEADKVDLALVLTEGIKKHIKSYPKTKIIAPYVNSPLVWGVFSHQDSSLNSLDDCKHKCFAISRFGSGSHNMAIELAKQKKWHEKDISFLTAGGIDALGGAVQTHKADVFLWEIFTTKPYMEKYQLKKVADFSAPWPAFQIAAKKEFDGNLINSILDIIFEVCDIFNKKDTTVIDFIYKKYKLEKQDIRAWIKSVEWATRKS